MELGDVDEQVNHIGPIVVELEVRNLHASVIGASAKVLWHSTLASEASVFANTFDGTLYAIVLGQFLDRVALEEVMTTSVDTPGWWLVFDCAPYVPLLPTD
eukprot:COSAG01_NODE_3451_length_6079_cov_14.325585_2_plen_101_part_00